MRYKVLFFTFFIFVITPNTFGDSLSIEEHVQIKLLEQKVDNLDKQLIEKEKNFKENQTEYRKQIEKNIDEKNTSINDKLTLYIGIFLALLAFVGGLLRYFGKDSTEKWMKQQVDAYLQLKISNEIIDSKITQLGKPIIEKLLNQIKDRKAEYDQLFEELANKQKGIDNKQSSQEDKEKFKEFSKVLDEIKEEKSFSEWDWNIKGVEQANLKNYEQASFFYTQAIDKNSNIETFYRNRGHAKYFLNKYEEAIADYDKAILIKEDEISYAGRAAAKNQLEQFENAILDSDSAIKLNSKYPYSYRHRAFANMKLKNLNQALLDINAAMELDPNSKNGMDLKQEIESLINSGK